MICYLNKELILNIFYTFKPSPQKIRLLFRIIEFTLKLPFSRVITEDVGA